MRAAGALPTEPRVQKMNDAQWLWYYLNLEKDREEQRKETEEKLFFANPQLFKSVEEIKKQQEQTDKNNRDSSNESRTRVVDENIVVVDGDTAVSDGFEAEMKRALMEAGEDPSNLTELPDSENVGNPNETREDFIDRVMKMQSFNSTEELNINGSFNPIDNVASDPIADIGDIDYIEGQDDFDYIDSDE